MPKNKNQDITAELEEKYNYLKNELEKISKALKTSEQNIAVVPSLAISFSKLTERLLFLAVNHTYHLTEQRRTFIGESLATVADTHSKITKEPIDDNSSNEFKKNCINIQKLLKFYRCHNDVEKKGKDLLTATLAVKENPQLKESKKRKINEANLALESGDILHLLPTPNSSVDSQPLQQLFDFTSNYSHTNFEQTLYLEIGNWVNSISNTTTKAAHSFEKQSYKEQLHTPLPHKYTTRSITKAKRSLTGDGKGKGL